MSKELTQSRLQEMRRLATLDEVNIAGGPVGDGARLPVPIHTHLDNCKIAAQNVADYAEMIGRAFGKIAQRCKELQQTAINTPDSIMGEARILLSNVRLAIESLEKADEKADEVLNGLDLILAGHYWPKKP